MRSPLLASVALALVVCCAPLALAQVQNVTSDVATPIPGVGHDYIKSFSETVNPASGSLSIRIDAGTPKARGLTLPFAFLYNSSGVNQPFMNPSNYTASWWTTSSQFNGVGWTYTIPALTAIQGQSSATNPGPPPVTNTCTWISNYVLQAIDGSRHMLPISIAQSGDDGTGCGGPGGPSIPLTLLSGADAFFQATTQWQSQNGVPTAPAPVTISDLDGTVYYFQNFGVIRLPGPVFGPGTSVGYSGYPAWIKDRNGNILQMTVSSGTTTLTDSAGRPAAVISPITNNSNTVTISGRSTPYNVQWETASSNFTTSEVYSGASFDAQYCPTSRAILANPQSSQVIQTLTLPNGKSYQFQYDSTYGLLNKITYPSGGAVTYTWGQNPYAASFSFPVNNISGASGVVCSYQYSLPAVTKRVVSFDGVNPAVEQDFTYVNNWNSSTPTTTTTVQTYDRITGQSFETVYTYKGVPAPNPPNGFGGPGISVEQTVTYYKDMGITLAKTVTKAWYDQYNLACETDTLDNGQISADFSSYATLPSLGVMINALTDKKEFDYGQITSTSFCQMPSSNGLYPPPSGVTPPVETSISYASFPATPSFPSGPSIFGQPSSIKVYANGTGGTLMSETDYAYDSYGPGGITPVTAVSHDDPNYPATYTNRGNATTITRHCLQSCTNAVTTLSYDETGQIVGKTDPCGNASCTDMPGVTNHSTTYSYADSYAPCGGTAPPSGSTNAYLTNITNALGQSQSFCYGYNDGQLRGSTDANSQTTSYTYNTPPSGCGVPDGLDRLSSVIYPDGGKTTYCYNDAPYNANTPSPSVTTAKLMTTTPTATYFTALTAFDGLGHAVRSLLTSDPQSTVYTDTSYDGLGRVRTQSNPHRSGSASTDGTTTYFYDSLGRTCLVVPQDGTLPANNTCPAANPGNDVVTLYSGNTATLTDQYGIKRKSVTDALGRLTQVFEDPGGLNYETDYLYDTLDNLICAAQKGTDTTLLTSCASASATWRPRSFAYDSLSRLSSATNPESGTITYTYDANGNASSKTAPAPNQTGTATVTTTFQYDALNRLKQKSYSDGGTAAPTPSAYFLYDLSNPWGSTYTNNYYVGRLDEIITKNSSGTWLTSSFFLHGPTGRVTEIGQCTPSNCGVSGFHTLYSFDLLGDLTSFRTTENNITFSYGYNSAARPVSLTSSLVDAQHPATLATVNSSVGYWAFGGLRMITMGNGLTETTAYNSRLQPCRMNVNSSGSWYNLCNATVANGTVQDFTYGWGLGSSDNGDLLSMSASGARAFNRTYSYGQLNRLSSMSAPSDPSGCTGLSWSYDLWGNRTLQQVTGGTCNTFSASVNTKNQFVGTPYQYDAPGNMINDGSHAYYYDAENRLIQAGGTLGNCANATACYTYDAEGRRVRRTVGSAVTQYVYDVADQVIHEADGSSAFTAYYISFAGKLLAQYKNSTTQFIHTDHLGSTRLVTGMTNPSTPLDTLDYLPFGEQISGDTATTHKFNGKERDSESGLDNFGARFDSSQFGRFTSADPNNVGAASTDPQSWNGYSYVSNNSLNHTDPDGRDYYVCINNESGGQNCTTVGNDAIFKNEVKNSPGVSLQGTDEQGEIFANGQDVGTYQHFIGPGNEGTSEDTILAPTVFFAAAGVARNLFRAGAALAEDFFGAGGRAGAETVSGFSRTAFGTVTREALEAAANSGGPTIRLVTNLTQVPVAGRALSAAAGEGAGALANAMREGGTTFVANVPKALIDQMARAGLVDISTTSTGGAGGAVAQELRFTPQAAEFVVKFFRAVH